MVTEEITIFDFDGTLINIKVEAQSKERANQYIDYFKNIIVPDEKVFMIENGPYKLDIERCGELKL